MDAMAFGGMQLERPGVNTDPELSAVERKEAAVMEQIIAQGANIAKATKDAYRPVLVAFKVRSCNVNGKKKYTQQVPPKR